MRKHTCLLLALSQLCRSFFQGLCVLGYCVAPLNIAALVSTFVHLIYVRAPVALAAWAWCVWGTLLRAGVPVLLRA